MSSAKRHPLRPLENAILVCEGEDDLNCLREVLQDRAPDIYLVEARGSRNVSFLAAILSPAVHVRDRDFEIELEVARQTLESEKSFTCWPRVDLEAYLLYGDWLLDAVQSIQNSPEGGVGNPPPGEEAVRQDMGEIAGYFVADHAGRRTLAELNRLNNPVVELTARPDRSVIQGNAEASEQRVWQQYLITEAERLRLAATSIAYQKELAEEAVRERFTDYVARYAGWSSDIATVREQFSGKRIFMQLASRWQVRSKPKSKPWKVLRDEVVRHMARYSQEISGYLRDDSRLGYIGLLASKVVGRVI
jgi:hypothetical protein